MVLKIKWDILVQELSSLSLAETWVRFDDSDGGYARLVDVVQTDESVDLVMQAAATQFVVRLDKRRLEQLRPEMIAHWVDREPEAQVALEVLTNLEEEFNDAVVTTGEPFYPSFP
jgi:hypothetical protein